MTREAKIEIIERAYESALESTGLSFTVYEDGETGDFYIFEDVAGGNSQPARAWEGKDAQICSFCRQNWRPEDGDPLFRENLFDFLPEGERAEVFARDREEECEISGDEIAKMFPARYDEYAAEVIASEMAEFDAEEFLKD